MMNKQSTKKKCNLKLKKGDLVVVLAGKDKGKRGSISRVLPTQGRVIVEGVNMSKKAVKPNPQLQEKGGIVAKENSLHISNVAIINPKSDRADKVGYKLLDDGSKVRVYRSTGEQIVSE